MLTGPPIINLLILLVTGSLFVYTSCGIDSQETQEEKLNAYCVRECVLEVGDSSLCDTRCDCASKILSEKLSNEEYSKLVNDITRGDSQDLKRTESVKEFEEAIKHCKLSKF